MSFLIQKLNANKFFKFVSSVKLAIPLMLILAIVVATGTVFESQYNSEYSNLLIYKTTLFEILMFCLWINILCATISRIPFQKRHTGFVITHIGILTLLIGGFVTNHFGLDGQLSITEGVGESQVVLSNLMVGYQIEGQISPQTIAFKKMIFPKEGPSLDFLNNDLNSVIHLNKYLPFSKIDQGYISDSEKSNHLALSFILKSPFFNISEWLNSDSKSEIQMGPALIRLNNKKNSAFLKNPIESQKILTNINKEPEKLVLTNLDGSKQLQSWPIKQIQGDLINFKNLKIKILKKYKSAIVSQNKLVENQTPETENSNPALELQIESNRKILREVLYAKFDNFSLNKDGIFGYRLKYVSNLDSNTNTNSESPDLLKPGSRIIDLQVDQEATPITIVVTLLKDNKVILTQKVIEGEKLVTPWMGIELYIGSVIRNAILHEDVSLVNPEKRSELPPSALQIKVNNEELFWLSEGEEKNIYNNDKSFKIFFGRETFQLPFQIRLIKFSKLDYPGTSTPISYESTVEVDGYTSPIKISMNEPLKKEGYTIYQASYVLNPNQPPVSIFSVNKDPGRIIKYIGSLILSLGVLIFTLMRSRFYQSSRSALKK